MKIDFAEKCACPWCPKEVVEGCESMMGEATCFDHSFEETLKRLEAAVAKADSMSEQQSTSPQKE